MSITISPDHTQFRGRDRRRRPRAAAECGRLRADPAGVLEICGACFPCAGPDARTASGVFADVRPCRNRAYARPEIDAEPLYRRVRRHLESRRRWQDLGRVEPPAHILQGGQQAVAYRQLVQVSAEPVFAALWPHGRAGRRTHRICRSARGVRCIAGRNEEEAGRRRRRALHCLFTSAQRLCRIHGRRAASSAARAADARAHDSA